MLLRTFSPQNVYNRVILTHIFHFSPGFYPLGFVQAASSNLLRPFLCLIFLSHFLLSQLLFATKHYLFLSFTLFVQQKNRPPENSGGRFKLFKLCSFGEDYAM